MLEFLLVLMFIPQALLPLVALLYASGIIQDEQEEQTITYLLVRPIPKWAIYTVKMLATMTTTVVLVAVFTLLTYVAIYVGADVPVREVAVSLLKAAAIHSLAIIAYCSLFGLMSLLTKRTLVVGILYTAIVEGLLANLPFGIRLVTVIYYTRLIAYRTMDFVVHWPARRDERLRRRRLAIRRGEGPRTETHTRKWGRASPCLLLGSVVADDCWRAGCARSGNFT